MKKIMILLGILSILFISGVVAQGYVYLPEAGRTEDIVVSFYSKSYAMRNVKATAYIPDLDVYSQSYTFNVRQGKPTRVHFEVDFPDDAGSECYPVRLSSYNDDGLRKVGHKWICLR
ncbi:hypothetical protein JXC34_05175 [Candidatus Woesearchaeota archaeon]|nr:hypothetical protein [Candidatus Woesearchaeota archaeon]